MVGVLRSMAIAWLFFLATTGFAGAFELGRWQLDGMSGATSVLTVSDSSVSWFDGCNTFSRSWVRSGGDKISFGPAMGTNTVCRTREDVVGPMLEQTVSVSVLGGEMTLKGGDDTVLGRLKRLP